MKKIAKILLLLLLLLFVIVMWYIGGLKFNNSKAYIQENEDENNTNLSILRADVAGIIPEFEKEIKEYYITLQENVKNIEITAVPENENSKVEITGNTNLQNGENVISIKVTSANGKNNSEYKIYVTKTENLEQANANLENLSIEYYTLEPNYEEQVTNYKVEVEPDAEKLNILAIPQNPNAKVEITGNNNLKQGKNEVTITVIAENGETFKKYKINVYKKSKQEAEDGNTNQNYAAQNYTVQNYTEQNGNGTGLDEENQNKINPNSKATRMSTVVGAANLKNNSEEEQHIGERSEEEKTNAFFVIGGIILAILVAGIVVIIIRKITL